MRMVGRIRVAAGCRVAAALAIILAVLAAGAARGGEPTDIMIRRDTWGVPHVFAPSLADAAYALGYAQAEDRLEQIYANYRLAIGRAAEVKGPEAVEDDLEQRVAGHEAVCRRRYPELPAEVRGLCEAYQDGVRAYLDDHPAARPANALDIEPWMVPATLRRLILHWPTGRAKRELGGKGTSLFSNQWAVRPERTADGAALLLIDPHVPWDGLFRFYEFRLHAAGVDLAGFGPVGTPLLGLGHNAFLGWACTTGGPDTTDVFVEEVDPANPRRYRYDGGWREMTSETVTIAVRGRPAVVRTIDRSHHGPIVSRQGTRAYAVACPYFDEIDAVTQSYRMMTARSLADFDAALGMNQLMEQNVMYADVAGNIRYVRTGRVPIRPPGFDFSRPVPGDTSRSEWLGLHPMRDLVQALNPAGGYLQNCNIAPDVMAKGIAIDAADYPPYVFDSGPRATNTRGRRALELLETHPRLTVDEAMAVALDTHADRCDIWQKALRDAAGRVDIDRQRGGVTAGALRRAVDTLAAWDGMMDQESVGATLYRGLRIAARARKVDPRSPPAALVDALADAVAWLEARYGTAEIPYGRVHRVRRGNRSWPASGGDSGGGDQTLRAIVSTLDGAAFYGDGGQNWLQLVQFRPGAVRSWSLTCYGQSDDPESPHYADQAEKLFSPGIMKPTWFDPRDLEGHVESTRVLPPPAAPRR